MISRDLDRISTGLEPDFNQIVWNLVRTARPTPQLTPFAQFVCATNRGKPSNIIAELALWISAHMVAAASSILLQTLPPCCFFSNPPTAASHNCLLSLGRHTLSGTMRREMVVSASKVIPQRLQVIPQRIAGIWAGNSQAQARRILSETLLRRLAGAAHVPALLTSTVSLGVPKPGFKPGGMQFLRGGALFAFICFFALYCGLAFAFFCAHLAVSASNRV